MLRGRLSTTSDLHPTGFFPSWIRKGEKSCRCVGADEACHKCHKRRMNCISGGINFHPRLDLTFSPFLVAPLVDLTPSHSGSAMLMLLSVVFVGLAVFVIYKFKRYDHLWAIFFSPLLPFTEVLGFCFAGFSFSQPVVSWFIKLILLPLPEYPTMIISVNILGRFLALIYMHRCRMKKIKRWSVQSVRGKAYLMSLKVIWWALSN